jgi:sec-independent protein translocase protein TatB
MFDIGFFELVLISVVSLLVLGPEKLPGAIRTITLWIGRLRRSFNTIKQDIEREVGADEIRRQLRNEEIMERFRKTQSTVKNTISDVQKKTDEFRKNIDLEAQAAASTSNDKNTGADSGTTGAADAETRAFAEPAAGGSEDTADGTSKPGPQGDG